MGSGTNNRKKNDAPIIRRPIKKAGFGGFGGSDIGTIAADICLPSFDQRVRAISLTQPGVTVRLQADANGYATVYHLYIGDSIIGRLNEKHSAMVQKCTKMGVRYSGKMVVKNGAPYARFIRVPR